MLTKSIVLQEVGFPELTCILEEDLVHVCGGVLEELVVRVEDDDGDLAVAEDAQLVGLLHEAELPLREGHLTVTFVGDPGNRNLLAAHLVDPVLFLFPVNPVLC